VLDTDVVIVGSGSGALVAANRAAAGGASVTVIEASAEIGGGSALSTGLVFAAGHHRSRAAGRSDSRDEATRYLTALNRGVMGNGEIRAFVDDCVRMTDWVHEETPVELVPVAGLPDFYPEQAAGRTGGRHLVARPFDARALGARRDQVRRSADPALSFDEIDDLGGPAMTRAIDRTLIATRRDQDIRTQGAGLVAALVAGAISNGVEFRLGARVDELVMGRQSVDGVRIAGTGEVVRARAIVLASGGFEWNADWNSRHLAERVTGPLTPPGNRGDGHRLVAGIGGELALMHESVWVPVIRVPGERYDGAPRVRSIAAEKSRPHAIIVDAAGNRVVNESANYCDVARRLARSGGPAYLVMDSAYLARYGFGTAPQDGTADGMFRDDTLAGLAKKAGIDPRGLERTVMRHDRMSRAGEDDDFGRGSSAFDRYYGDPEVGPNPALGGLSNPPFVAVQVEVGTFGNRGGVVTDHRARALQVSGAVIPGLYAVGNVAAQLACGRGYEGGATLAHSMTGGFRAAESILAELRRSSSETRSVAVAQ